LLALLVVHAAGFAQDPAPPPPPPPTVVPRPITRNFYDSPERWQMTDRRARGVYTAGLIVGMAGLAFDVAGRATGEEGMQGFGVFAELVGSPMMAGASLRSARALREQGAQVPRGAGTASWTLWAGSFVFGFAAIGTLDDVDTTSTDSHYDTTYEATNTSIALGYTALACRVAAYVAAGMQAGANNRGRASLGQSHVMIAPTYDGHTMGVVLVSDAF